MGRLLVVVATAALLAAGSPVAQARPLVSTGWDEPSPHALVSGPGSRPLPFRLTPPEPPDGCVLPIASMRPCDLPRKRRPARSCVVPVIGPTLLVPECPEPRGQPEGRIVPLQSARLE